MSNNEYCVWEEDGDEYLVECSSFVDKDQIKGDFCPFCGKPKKFVHEYNSEIVSDVNKHIDIINKELHAIQQWYDKMNPDAQRKLGRRVGEFLRDVSKYYPCTIEY